MKISINKEKLFAIAKILLLALVCLFGVFLRMKAYLMTNSLFLDEAALALNVMNKGFLELFLPLEYGQVPPPFFAIFSKIVITIVGCSEYTFRFIPLCSSILAIFIFWYIANKLFKNYFTVLASLVLFSLSYPLTFYAQDFKQYSSDVLVFLMCYALCFFISFRGFGYKKLTFVGLVYAFWVWCSHPVAFFVGSALCVYSVKFLFEKDYDALKKTYFTFAFPLVSLLLLYFINLNSWHGEQGLIDYWRVGLDGFSFALFKNNMLSFFVYLNDSLNVNILITYLLCLLFTGIFLFWRSNRVFACLLLVPLLLNILASQLQMYPFQGRLILYLIPIIVLFVSKPLDLLKKDSKLQGILVLLIFIVAFKDLFFTYPQKLLKGVEVRFQRHETRPLYEVMYDKAKPDDLVYVYHLIEKSFRFYDKQYELSRGVVFRGGDKFPQNLEELNTLPKGKRVWFLFVNDNFSAQEVAYMKAWIEDNCEDKMYFISTGSFMIYAKIK